MVTFKSVEYFSNLYNLLLCKLNVVSLYRDVANLASYSGSQYKYQFRTVDCTSTANACWTLYEFLFLYLAGDDFIYFVNLIVRLIEDICLNVP